MHQATGYLPITMAAYELTKKSGFYDKNPGTDVAVQQMIVKTTDNSRGVRARQLRADPRLIDEELEAVWAGKKTAKEALDDGGEARQRAARAVRQGEQGLSTCATAMRRRVRRPSACRQRGGLRRATMAAWKSASSSGRAGCRTR